MPKKIGEYHPNCVLVSNSSCFLVHQEILISLSVNCERFIKDQLEKINDFPVLYANFYIKNIVFIIKFKIYLIPGYQFKSFDSYQVYQVLYCLYNNDLHLEHRKVNHDTRKIVEIFDNEVLKERHRIFEIMYNKFKAYSYGVEGVYKKNRRVYHRGKFRLGEDQSDRDTILGRMHGRAESQDGSVTKY